MPNDFITLDYLATFAGMVIVVGLIVQATKSFIKNKWSDAAVRGYTYFIALIIVAIINWNKGIFNVSGSLLAVNVLLTFINALVVTLVAMGGYEVLADPKATKAFLDK